MGTRRQTHFPQDLSAYDAYSYCVRLEKVALVKPHLIHTAGGINQMEQEIVIGDAPPLTFPYCIVKPHIVWAILAAHSVPLYPRDSASHPLVRAEELHLRQDFEQKV